MILLVKQYIAGVFIGISNVIPGVSGGTMAVVFNVYDKLIEALSLNIKSIKKNFVFLVIIGFGIVTGILLFTNIMNVLLTRYPNETYAGFVGVIIGSLPIVIKVGNIEKINMRNILAFVLFFGFMVGVWLLQDQQASIVSVEVLTLAGAVGLFFAASVSTFTMLVPGISGSLLLVMIGYYHAIFTFTIRQLVFPQLIVVGAGMLFGLLIGAKIVSYLIMHHKDLVYSAILGLIVGSLFSLFPSLEAPLIPLIIMVGVGLLTYWMNRKSMA